MHILLITHYFAPDSGAAANRLTRLAHALQARGHAVTVLTTMPHYPLGIIPPEYRRRFTVVEDREGVRVIQVWLWARPDTHILPRLFSQLSFMISAMLRGLFLPRPDVILIENQPIFTGLAGWFISRVKRAPYVLNVSDYWPEYLVVAGIVSERSLTYRLFRALTNLTQRGAGGIVAMLDDLLVKIEARIGPVANGVVIHNTVDLQRFHPTADGAAFRAKHDLGDAQLVTFLGGLGPHIDLETMLMAARGLADLPDVRVFFVGTGMQKDRLAAALEMPDMAHCRWIEWIDQDALPGFWAASAVNFWALHDNGVDRMRFQAKLYEALASGTPVVIAVEGLMSDILSRAEAGITVAPGDAAGLEGAIRQLLEDPQLSDALSANARRYAEVHFAPEPAFDAYEQLLLNAAGKN